MGNEDFWTVSFAKEAELLEAVRRLRDAGHEIADVYTPYPIHGLDELLELRPSRLGWVTFGAGAFGGLSAFAFQAWSSSASWPLNVGGKPNVSTLAFIPITFEVTVLCAGLATAAAFLLKSRLYPRPRPAVAERITDDRFALVLDPLAGSLGESELRRLFAEAGADSVVASGGGEPGRAGLKPRARRQSPARGLGARFSGLRLLARGFSPVRKRAKETGRFAGGEAATPGLAFPLRL